MSNHSNFVQQRLDFAKDLLRAGNVHRAISICEDLLSPASILSHGKDIFTFIADAMERSGDITKAQLIRARSIELFSEVEDESILTVNDIHSAEQFLSEMLPAFSYPDDTAPDFILYDELQVSYAPIPIIHTESNIQIHRSPETQRSFSALEELAKRLENATIPAIQEERTIQSPSFMPSVVTETMAEIYVQQGAYSQAIKAYQILARNAPEKREFFESKIVQLRNLQ